MESSHSWRQYLGVEAREGQRMRRRAGVVACALAMLSAAPLWAAESGATQAMPLLDPSAIAVPEEAGHIVSTHVASTPAQHHRTIIHIQDAHTNYEAQKHLAAIVDAMAKRHGIQLVLVEGGVDDASLSYLRAHATPEKRLEVAEQFLKAGEISGEEYLDLIADYPLTLWGVETQELYDANLKAFLDGEQTRARVKPQLAALRAAVDAVTARVYPNTLARLLRARKAYEAGELSFANYLAGLEKLLEHAKLSLSAYPSLAAFRQAQALESKLNMPKVQEEQTQALNFLRAAAPAKDLEPLYAAGRAMQDGTGAPYSFYAELKRQMETRHLDEELFPHLWAYIRHATLTNEITTAQLSKELARCGLQLHQALADDPQVRQLARVDQELALVERLFSLEMTPDEHAQLTTALQDASMSARWQPTLTQFRVDPAAVAHLAVIESAMPQCIRFYVVAQQRDQVMVELALSKMEEMGAPSAVLIAGGFHTPRITQLFNEHGVDVVVVAPQVTQATDEALYHRMLKYKAGIPMDMSSAPATDHIYVKR